MILAVFKCLARKITIRRSIMGEKGSKKDKNKAIKQKQEQAIKKKEQQNAKQPTKKA